jgi:regulatory protein YycI of two-component signal transduction system YycFG
MATQKTSTIQLQKQNPNFEKTIQEAIDETFSLLGENSKKTIYQHLENDYKIAKKEIPSKIAAFADALEQSFGVGAKLIEMNIIKALHEKNQDFMFFPKKGEIVFTEYVEKLQGFLTP